MTKRTADENKRAARAAMDAGIADAAGRTLTDADIGAMRGLIRYYVTREVAAQMARRVFTVRAK